MGRSRNGTILRTAWVWLFLGFALRAHASDWPQLQNGPQRLGYAADKIDAPFKNAWARGFSPERLHPQAQPVVADGRLFIGTEMANFYALDAKTGKQLWQHTAGGPILHTAGIAGGKVFYGCLDGTVQALNAADGTPAWKFESGLRTGFSTAVLLAEGNVFIANRGGRYYALSQKDGSVVWQRDLGVPVLMSSACDKGKVFFGAMDMRVYALDSKSGNVLWQSDPLPGAAFKDYCPVVYKDVLLVRPMKVSGGAGGPAIEWFSGPLPESEFAKQDALLKTFEKQPASKNLFVLDPNTGKEAFVVPHWVTDTMNGATCPPCTDAAGLLIVPVTLHDWRGGWGRLDLDKRRVVEVLAEEKMDPKKTYKRGTGNSDENLCVSAAGQLVFTIHTEEGNAHFTGAWHLGRREWTPIAPYHADQSFSSNTQGGGGTAFVIADGMLFHTSWNTLNARTTTPAP
ncbi:MAG: PQQ-binding-like beta-propeller repeat protein [Planctomycetota bacterium]|nr:PQQ-binding-like beta-propeller repeat protein [Planctomycetota bacterium]